MKFPRISISDLLPTQMVIWWRGGSKVQYLPNTQNLSKKIVAGVLACLGLGLLGCAAFAAAVCQTIFPCIGLMIIGCVLLGIAYLQYSKGWLRLESPLFRKTNIFEKPINWLGCLSLLQSWGKIRPGCYYHPGCPQVEICEGSQEIIDKICQKKADRNTSLFLIQEMDRAALKQRTATKTTLSEKTFDIDPSVVSSLLSEIEGESQEESGPKVISWSPANEESHRTYPKSVIYVNIPEVSAGAKEYPGKQYIDAYSEAFSTALNQIGDPSIVKKHTIYILTPILGLPDTLPPEERQTIKLLSQAAFLYTAELVAEQLAEQKRDSIRIKFVLTDPTSATPLRFSPCRSSISRSPVPLSFSGFVEEGDNRNFA
ncbi:phage holin family protein [Candidatus Chlamydia corallus]|uniref:phage holin family protein n=1 Tax=Candidatus Chlamydia corallus TaxID=2038470 RepID=UPI000C2FD699|nr:phage holin family protein [Candidatus Chlamydia corallus]